MKKYNRIKKYNILASILAFTLSAAMLSGCQIDVSLGGYITGESYPNSAAYQIGSFSYESDKVNSIEIYWHSGEIELVESDNDDLSVQESGVELPNNAAMHHLLEDGTLRIRFCESDAKIHVNPNDKHITVELPKNINLSVHTTSASVRASRLSQKSILISAHSGNTEIGTAKAESVNLSSSSGFVQVDSVSAQTLKCNSSSGSIRFDEVNADFTDIVSSSGSVDLAVLAANQINIRTSSGNTSLHLPENGAEIAYTASSGKMHTEKDYERKGDLYVFGNGESRITVDSSSGNLKVR